MNKLTDLPNGISVSYENDKRYSNSKRTIVYSVVVSYEGKAKIKHFRVSNGLTESFVLSVACKFRDYYEDSIESGMEFHYHSFDGWNNV